jgi:hypothetical protein
MNLNVSAVCTFDIEGESRYCRQTTCYCVLRILGLGDVSLIKGMYFLTLNSSSWQASNKDSLSEIITLKVFCNQTPCLLVRWWSLVFFSRNYVMISWWCDFYPRIEVLFDLVHSYNLGEEHRIILRFEILI